MTVTSAMNNATFPKKSFWEILGFQKEEEKEKPFSWENYTPLQTSTLAFAPSTTSPVIEQMDVQPKPSLLQTLWKNKKSIGIGVAAGYLASTMLASVGLGAGAGIVVSLGKSIKENWLKERSVAQNLISTFTQKNTYKKAGISAAFATVGVVGVESFDLLIPEANADMLLMPEANAETPTTLPTTDDSDTLIVPNPIQAGNSIGYVGENGGKLITGVNNGEFTSAANTEINCKIQTGSWTEAKHDMLQNTQEPNLQQKIINDICVNGSVVENELPTNAPVNTEIQTPETQEIPAVIDMTGISDKTPTTITSTNPQQGFIEERTAVEKPTKLHDSWDREVNSGTPNETINSSGTTTEEVITRTPIEIDKPYTIASGDTLSEIVKKEYGLTEYSEIKAAYEWLAQENGINNPDKIYPGQEIILPKSIDLLSENTVTVNNTMPAPPRLAA